MSGNRIRLGPSDTCLLVPWHAIERGIDPMRARTLLTMALEDPQSAAAMRELAERMNFSVGLEDDAVVERIVELLTTGGLVVVRVPRDEAAGSIAPGIWPDARGSKSSSIPLLSELRPAATDTPTKPTRAATWIELCVVGEGAQSYAGSQIEVRDPEGGTRTFVLDDRSVSRIDDLPSDGTCWIGLSAAARPSGLAEIPVGGVHDPSGRLQPGGAPVGVRTAARHTLLVAQPKTSCVRLVGMLFELNKAFLLPPALEGIRLLTHMYEAMPGAQLLVVGHTDRTGMKYRNDSLSLDRASAVIAYVTDDVERWYAFYSKDTDESRRWGWTEDLAMLSTLPRSGTPYYSPEHDEHTFIAAIRRFQTDKGLVVDGDPGPLTRRALIAEYMALDGTSLPAASSALPHGCGENFPVVPTDDEVEELQNRRVEVFFFADGIDPMPSSSTSASGSTHYPAWNDAVEQERTFTPSAAGRGTLRIETDIEFEWLSESGVILQLRAVDGSYEAERPLSESAVSLGGYAASEFTSLPRGAFYTLIVKYPDGREDVAFSDVPYWELASVGEDSVVDPISGRPVAEQ